MEAVSQRTYRPRTQWRRGDSRGGGQSRRPIHPQHCSLDATRRSCKENRSEAPDFRVATGQESVRNLGVRELREVRQRESVRDVREAAPPPAGPPAGVRPHGGTRALPVLSGRVDLGSRRPCRQRPRSLPRGTRGCRPCRSPWWTRLVAGTMLRASGLMNEERAAPSPLRPLNPRRLQGWAWFGSVLRDACPGRPSRSHRAAGRRVPDPARIGVSRVLRADATRREPLAQARGAAIRVALVPSLRVAGTGAPGA